MNLHLSKNVMNPVNKFDAVNKAYVDRIKYKTATDNVPNIAMRDQDRKSTRLNSSHRL